MLDDRSRPVSLRRRPFGGAAMVSLGTHVALLLLAVAIQRHVPPPSEATAERPSLTQLVWDARSSPAGGQGGGDRNRAIARRATEVGRDRVTAPVAPRPDPAPHPQPPDAQPVSRPVIDAVPLAADATATVGVISLERATSADSRGAGDGPGAGPDAGRGAGDGNGPGAGDGVFGVGNDVTAPRLIRSVRPEYTPDAMRARVQGTVALECVVDPQGRVDRCRMKRSLDAMFGLDQQAIKAARQWSFEPGTRLGKPVAVFVTIELDFRIR